MTSPPNDPKHYSFVFATSVVKDGRPIEKEPFEKEARAFSAWRYNTDRAGPPTPPVYPDQQLDVGPVSFFPYPVRDPNNLPLTFSLLTPLPASLQIDPSTGEIYGNLDALDWDRSTCQVLVSNGAFSVTGPVFRLFAYAVGGIETRAIVYGIEYALHTFQVRDFGVSGQDFYRLNVLKDIPYAEYFLVAGGGGGGTDRGGGGGGGGIRIGDTSFGISSFEVLVGNGGDSYVSGYDSSLGSTVAVGGGAGGSSAAAVVSLNYGGGPPSTGGSGGGGSTTGTVPTSISFITGTVASSTSVNWWQGRAGVANQGNFGGNGPNIVSWPSFGYDPNRYGGAGGGGAGGVGSAGGFEFSGNGGVGIQINFTGVLTYYAGGGAGGSRYVNGVGGLGGGGTPGVSPNGTNGLGGGGAGGTSSVGGRGGSGLVVVRYPVYPEPAGVKRFGLVQWLDAADYTTGEIQWDDRVANYDAAMFNAPVKSADGGGSIQFNGTTNLGTYNTPTEVSPLSSFTIELWARWLSTGTGSATIQTILDNSSTVAAPSFRLQDRPDLGKSLVFEYRQTTGTTTLVSGVQVGDDSWHHIALACDFNAPTVRMYVDGELANAVPSPSAANRTIKPSTTIGRWDAGVPLGTPQYFSGKLAILRSYSRGLSADDVVNNFLNEAARFAVAPANAYGGVVIISVIDDTAYRVHTFYPSASDGATPGTFTVLADIIDADYIVVGGGGGGGASAGGGGGAGGLLAGSRDFSVGSFVADVGAGGAGAASNVTVANNGFSSTLDGLTAVGGGGGTSRLATASAGSGGSGGGGSGQVSGSVYLGATGTVGQGNNGGDGTGPLDAGTNSAGGGGGGAGATGSAAVSAIAGAGGIGVISSVTGLPVYYAGGGGGGISSNGTAGSGGLGGGGAGSSTAGSDGLARSGGGGGGGGLTGGRGGSGLIVVRYPTGSAAPVVDPNAANAYLLIPAFGYANSSVANWRDFSSGARTYNPLSAASFDGSGDYLTTPGTANFAFGTGDFTMEGWFYATASNRILIDTRPTSTQGLYPTVYLDSSSRVSFFQSTADRISSPAVQLNTWNHFAVVRSGSAVSASADPFYASVSLLLKADGPNNSTTFIDNSPNAFAVSRFGNTVISTAESKYGGSSALFDGNGDYLTAGDANAFNFGTGNFTVECWVYLPSLGSGFQTFCTTASPADTQGFYFGQNGGQLVFYVGAGAGVWNVTIQAGSISANTWTHVCGVRNGNVFTAYINGVQVGNQTLSITLTNTNNLISVGGRSNGSQWTNGYIDDLRVTKGVARYTANFTPPGSLPTFGPPLLGVVTTLYVNGFPVGFYTDPNNYLVGPVVVIGASSFNPAANNWSGSLSNFRVTKGVARYEAAYTQPTAELPDRTAATAGDANFGSVSLLLRAASPVGGTTFVDSSNNACAITRNGTPVISALSPFTDTASISFNGSTDFLTTPDSNLFLFTGDFTIEAWVYPTAAPSASGGSILAHWTSGIATQCSFIFYLWTGNRIGFSWGLGGVNTGFQGTTTTFPLNQWSHVAVTRAGSTVRLFVNGVQDATTGTVSGTLNDAPGLVQIGRITATDGGYLNGLLTDLRVTNGIARYTATFTRPTASFPSTTAPAPADAYYAQNVLLLRGNGLNAATNFSDLGPNSLAVTPVGNAQVSTAQSKWGGSSMFFDGSGDGLSLAANSTLYSFGVDDFTIECWFYLAGNSPTNGDGNRWGALCVSDVTGTMTGYRFLVAGNASTTGTGLYFDNVVASSVISITFTGTITQGAWHHAAVSRRGTLTRLFLDGSCVAVGTLSNQNITTANPFFVGRGQRTSYTHDFNGYIDDVRVSKVARYTANFVPPQRYNTGGADPNFANTSLLLAMDEPAGTRTFTDTSPSAVAVTTVGDTLTVNPSTGAWTIDNPKGYGGAVYLDGTANSLRTTLPSAFPPYVDGDFTLECWLNAGSSTSTSKGVFVGGDYNKASGNSLGIWLFGSEIRVNRVVNGTATTIISTTFVTNRWYHIALVRQSGILMLYIDGVAVGGVVDATRYYDSTFSLGASRATSGDANLYPLTGYMQDARAYSLAKYTSTDAQFPLNTMLLHFEGSNGSTTFTDSSFSNTALTANGNVQISTARSKWGTSSALFDGTGDFLSWAGTTFAASEDWTVECWVFKTAVDASGYTVLFWGSGNTQFSFDNTTAGSVSLVINGTAVIGASGTAVTLNTWHHLAWTRQGTTCRAFVNGVLQGTGTNSASFSLSNIGRYGQTPFGYEMNGNVDELRITKGFCRYTASFTPPTEAFPDRPTFTPPTAMVK